MIMCRVGVPFLVVLVIMTKTIAQEITAGVYVPRDERDVAENWPYNLDDEYVRQIHSMLNAYRSDLLGRRGRHVVETNTSIDTKYRTWKRNADLINSLLTLPKGMNEAGR